MRPKLRGYWIKFVVPEPWERRAMVDGTSAPDTDAELHAALHDRL